LVLPLSTLLANTRLTGSRRRQLWAVTVSLGMQVAGVILLWTIGNP